MNNKEKIKDKIKSNLIKKLSVLDFESSFAEIRGKRPGKKHENVLMYPSSFAEIRSTKNTNESDETEISQLVESVLENKSLALHDRDHPTKLNADQNNAISGYTHGTSKVTAGSSANMNGYLRNRMGSKKDGVFGGHSEDKVVEHIKHLSSAFDHPENTNREEIHLHSGVPPSIGNQIMSKGKGSIHVLPGFTSTSTLKKTGLHFAEKHSERELLKGGGDENIHVLKIKAPAGHALSVHHHSRYKDEHEYILNHGQHIKYHGTTERYTPAGKILTHNVSLVPNTRTHLDEYGKYDHPEHIDGRKYEEAM